MPGLLEFIRYGLSEERSPERIMLRLRRKFPDNRDIHVCTETIYQAISAQAKGELKREVGRSLRTGTNAVPGSASRWS